MPYPCGELTPLVCDQSPSVGSLAGVVGTPENEASRQLAPFSGVVVVLL